MGKLRRPNRRHVRNAQTSREQALARCAVRPLVGGQGCICCSIAASAGHRALRRKWRQSLHADQGQRIVGDWAP